MQHADALVASLEDSCFGVRRQALQILGHLEPATLAQHAEAVVARLDDSHKYVRREALNTLGKLEPAALAQHANAVLMRLWHSCVDGRTAALNTLRHLPKVMTRNVCFDSSLCAPATTGSPSVVQVPAPSTCEAPRALLVCASVSSERPGPCTRRCGMGSDELKRIT